MNWQNYLCARFHNWLIISKKIWFLTISKKKFKLTRVYYIISPRLKSWNLYQNIRPEFILSMVFNPRFSTVMPKYIPGLRFLLCWYFPCEKLQSVCLPEQLLHVSSCFVKVCLNQYEIVPVKYTNTWSKKENYYGGSVLHFLICHSKLPGNTVNS